jgi:hypothetical protein
MTEAALVDELAQIRLRAATAIADLRTGAATTGISALTKIELQARDAIGQAREDLTERADARG